ncbi:hypothetical protein FQA47_024132 [Oryzias melastigma]|uniref:Uncharacterized protein n=1 Tax=Oryzias melastigma TaxID=30732 RepID=A0A834FFF6_ORYME|nr:hypothetical protein FQA47_024132 [Oryzias melastigma]
MTKYQFKIALLSSGQHDVSGGSVNYNINLSPLLLAPNRARLLIPAVLQTPGTAEQKPGGSVPCFHPFRAPQYGQARACVCERESGERGSLSSR